MVKNLLMRWRQENLRVCFVCRLGSISVEFWTSSKSSRDWIDAHQVWSTNRTCNKKSNEISLKYIKHNLRSPFTRTCDRHTVNSKAGLKDFCPKEVWVPILPRLPLRFTSSFPQGCILSKVMGLSKTWVPSYLSRFTAEDNTPLSSMRNYGRSRGSP